MIGMDADPDRAWIQDRYRYASDSFDRAIVLIAGGAATLSVTFVDRLLAKAPRLTFLVLMAWIALAGSVLAITMSHYPAARAAMLAAERYKAKMAGLSTDDLSLAIDARNRMAMRLSVLAGILLAVGLFLLAVFAYTNLPEGR